MTMKSFSSTSLLIILQLGLLLFISIWGSSNACDCGCILDSPSGKLYGRIDCLQRTTVWSLVLEQVAKIDVSFERLSLRKGDWIVFQTDNATVMIENSLLNKFEFKSRKLIISFHSRTRRNTTRALFVAHYDAITGEVKQKSWSLSPGWITLFGILLMSGVVVAVVGYAVFINSRERHVKVKSPASACSSNEITSKNRPMTLHEYQIKLGLTKIHGSEQIIRPEEVPYENQVNKEFCESGSESDTSKPTVIEVLEAQAISVNVDADDGIKADSLYASSFIYPSKEKLNDDSASTIDGLSVIEDAVTLPDNSANTGVINALFGNRPSPEINTKVTKKNDYESRVTNNPKDITRYHLESNEITCTKGRSSLVQRTEFEKRISNSKAIKKLFQKRFRKSKQRQNNYIIEDSQYGTSGLKKVSAAENRERSIPDSKRQSPEGASDGSGQQTQTGRQETTSSTGQNNKVPIQSLLPDSSALNTSGDTCKNLNNQSTGNMEQVLKSSTYYPIFNQSEPTKSEPGDVSTLPPCDSEML